MLRSLVVAPAVGLAVLAGSGAGSASVTTALAAVGSGLAGGGVTTARAQTDTPGSATPDTAPAGAGRWHFTIPIGVWPFGVQGPIGVGGFSKDVDLSIDDVQELKDRALGFAFEAGRDRITGMVQALFYRFQPDASTAELPNGTLVTGSPRLEWFAAELAGAYRVLTLDPGPGVLMLEPFMGARFTRVTASVQVEEPEETEIGERDVSWVDGFAGVRVIKSFTRHIAATFRGDVGAGGANFSWHAAGSVGYRFPFATSALTVALGYKGAGIDYESDEQDEFLMDATMTGPTLGVAYSF